MPTSRITRTISLLYRLQSDDIAKLEGQLLESRKRAWASALRAEAAEHGCKAAPNAPRREDLERLKDMCREDAKSIASTWNREVEREIDRIREATPRANRRTYYKRLEAWNTRRNEWKLPQISVTTDVTTRAYAQERFRSMNYSGGLLFVLVGPPAVCKICASMFAAGVVDQAYVNRHRPPFHPFCAHGWGVVNRPKLQCGEIWLG